MSAYEDGQRDLAIMLRRVLDSRVYSDAEKLERVALLVESATRPVEPAAERGGITTFSLAPEQKGSRGVIEFEGAVIELPDEENPRD